MKTRVLMFVVIAVAAFAIWAPEAEASFSCKSYLGCGPKPWFYDVSCTVHGCQTNCLIDACYEAQDMDNDFEWLYAECVAEWQSCTKPQWACDSDYEMCYTSREDVHRDLCTRLESRMDDCNEWCWNVPC